jgi:hypothetical protein
MKQNRERVSPMLVKTLNNEKEQREHEQREEYKDHFLCKGVIMVV